VVLALSYGSRQEITAAARKLAQKVQQGELQPQDITPELLADNLYTAGMPDPDLLIRTSGEMRISNYLLWQISYSEIWVTDVLWPDFGRKEMDEALLAYTARDRRFGKR
jgi:undecaprenyl diphosphate synthase